MHLTLIVPELIWPEPDDGEAFDALDCPALSTILRRGRLGRSLPQSFEATLYDAFGFSGDPSYAALRRLGESAVPDPTNGYWICADPVHLRYHEELLILADSGSFELSQEEALALAESLNAHFSELSRFHVATSGRWYLQLSDSGMIETVGVAPLSNVAGRALDHERPVTAAQKALHRLLTEIQMLLHTHPVNQKREAAGRMPINSLWLWGSGPLPAPDERVFDDLWSCNALAVGLARHTGTRVHEAARDAAEVLDGAKPDSRHAVVLEDLLAPAQYQKRDAYRDALADLDTRWFAPLHTALRGGRLKQLRIEASTAYGLLTWECSRADLWVFWKRPVPLATTAKELARE